MSTQQETRDTLNEEKSFKILTKEEMRGLLLEKNSEYMVESEEYAVFNNILYSRTRYMPDNDIGYDHKFFCPIADYHKKTYFNVESQEKYLFDVKASLICECGNDKLYISHPESYETFAECPKCGVKESVHSG